MDAIIKKANFLQPMEKLKIITHTEWRFNEIATALVNSGWSVWVSAFPDKVFSRKDGAVVELEYIDFN